VTTPGEPVSFGQRLADLARSRPNRIAAVFVTPDGARMERTWRELDRASNVLARTLKHRGATPQTMVVVCLRNVVQHVEVTLAAWKIGACVLPLSPRLPASERAQILEVLDANRLVVSDGDPDSALDLSVPAVLREIAATTAAAVPIRTPDPGKAIGSGGSTGRSKVIVAPGPWEGVPGAADPAFREIGFRPDQVQLVAGPLYHNAPFSLAHYGLFEGHTLVVMERFDAALAVALIEEFRVEFAFLAPTMMLRINRLPDLEKRDLSSLTAVYHTAMACPAWLKRDWIARVGAAHVHEAYGASENIGYTAISGTEWLEHPTSVGRPRHCEVRILDETGAELPSGEVGLVHLRNRSARAPSYRYLGSEPLPTTPDGFASVGDLGWLDHDGYLHIADRRTDLIISGGVNVYPAEVEAVLLRDPAVADTVVIGLSDPEWGRRVHAVVEPSDPARPPTRQELDARIAGQLSPAKRPKSYEFLTEFPRDESGKVRRSLLVSERDGTRPAEERAAR
jgi:bile acid-coenzyme A ligase